MAIAPIFRMGGVPVNDGFAGCGRPAAVPAGGSDVGGRVFGMVRP